MPFFAGQVVTSAQMNRLANVPRARMLQTTTSQTLPAAGDWVNINWDAAQYDSHSGWDALNPARYTAQVAGKYRISGGLGVNSDPDGHRDIRWIFNLTTVITGSYSAVPAVDGNSSGVVARPITIEMAIGDSVLMQARSIGAGNDVGTGVGTEVQSTMEVLLIHDNEL